MKFIKVFCLVVAFSVFSSSLYSQEALELQEVVVSAKLNPEKLMKKAAEHFCKKKAKTFMSEIIQYRGVKSGDTYLEFSAFNGLFGKISYSNDNKKLYINNMDHSYSLIPINVIRSDAYGVKGELMDERSLDSKLTRTIKDYYTGFNSRPFGSSIDLRLIAELNSPLNPKMVKLYDYKILNMYEDIDNNQWVRIEFKNKAGVFPKKCRLLANGTILYNISKRCIHSIELSNYLDFYTRYIRDNDYKYLSTEHKAIISYKESGGYIFPMEITLAINWIKPKNIGDNDLVHDIEPNPRRNPYKYKISTIENIKFKQNYILDKSECKELRKILDKRSSSYLVLSEYSAPFRKEYWDKCEFKGIDINKVKSDLNRGGKTLYEQCKDNSNNGFDIYGIKHIAKEKIEMYRKQSNEYYKIGEMLLNELNRRK
jgi:hypothetical protein